MTTLVKSSQATDEDLLPDLTPVEDKDPDITATPLTSDVSAGKLNHIHDVPVRVSAVLGKTRMNIASLMNLTGGDVIELDRKVGEPIDLYVNDRLIARGELVMVDGSLGVTLTEVVKDDDL